MLIVGGEALRSCGTVLEDKKNVLNNNASVLTGEGGVLKVDA